MPSAEAYSSEFWFYVSASLLFWMDDHTHWYSVDQNAFCNGHPTNGRHAIRHSTEPSISRLWPCEIELNPNLSTIETDVQSLVPLNGLWSAASPGGYKPAILSGIWKLILRQRESIAAK